MTPTPNDQRQPGRLQAAGAETVREQDKIMLVLAYLSCLSLIPYLTVKDSEFVRWHARQGVVLLCAWVLLGTGVPLVLTVIGIGACLGPILNLGFLGLSIMSIVKALRGERWRIPVLADLADKF